MANTFRVMVRCPTTQQVFDTGIKTSGREALTNNAYQDGVFSCRFCDKFHSLDVDAFFAVEPDQHSGQLWRPNP